MGSARRVGTEHIRTAPGGARVDLGVSVAVWGAAALAQVRRAERYAALHRTAPHLLRGAGFRIQLPDRPDGHAACKCFANSAAATRILVACCAIGRVRNETSMKLALIGWWVAAGALGMCTACGKGPDKTASPGPGADASARGPALGPGSGTAPGAASGAASGAGGAPVSVTTARAERRDVDVMLEATGTVAALNNVEIRSQVSSVITRVNIREG